MAGVWISRLLLAASLACGLGFLWMAMAAAPAPQGKLELETTEVAVGPFVEHKAPAELVVLNRSNRPAKVVGANSGCHPGGCLEADLPPETIPPGGSATVPFRVYGCKPGPFALEAKVYLDHGGALRSLDATLSGVRDDSPGS